MMSWKLFQQLVLEMVHKNQNVSAGHSAEIAISMHSTMLVL
jgi:hypothetical protein